MTVKKIKRKKRKLTFGEKIFRMLCIGGLVLLIGYILHINGIL